MDHVERRCAPDRARRDRSDRSRRAVRPGGTFRGRIPRASGARPPQRHARRPPPGRAGHRPQRDGRDASGPGHHPCRTRRWSPGWRPSSDLRGRQPSFARWWCRMPASTIVTKHSSPGIDRSDQDFLGSFGRERVLSCRSATGAVRSSGFVRPRTPGCRRRVPDRAGPHGPLPASDGRRAGSGRACPALGTTGRLQGSGP